MNMTFSAPKSKNTPRNQKNASGESTFIGNKMAGGISVNLISKKRLYGKHGVLEYWIIDPKERFVEVYENTEGDMQLAQKVEEKGTVSSQVVSKFKLGLKDLF